MNSQPAPAPALVSDERQNEAGTQLHGRWLVLGWIVWLAVVVPIAVTFLTNLPGNREIEYRSNLISAPSLQHIGVSVDFFASYYLGAGDR